MGDNVGFFGPYMRALEAANFIQDIKFKQEARAQQRQQWAMELEDRKRQRAMEDFQTHMAMSDLGMLPVQPDVKGKFEAGLGGRGTVEIPGLGQYSIPTPEQQFERQKARAQQTGRLKSMEKDVEDPWTAVPAPKGITPDAPFGQVKVRESQKVDIIKKLLERKTGPLVHTSSINDAGDRVTTFFDTEGNMVHSITEKGAGKSARATAAKTGISAGAERAFKDAQAAIDLANAGPKTTGEKPPTGTIARMQWEKQRGQRDEERKKQADMLWEKARAAVNRALTSYPDELEGEIKPWPRITAKERQTPKSTVPSGTTPQGSATKRIPASMLPKLLTHPDVQKRGIKDVNALRKDLAAHGYEILEDQ